MKLSTLSTVALSVILFIGCSNTPEDAISNTYDAIIEGDGVKLSRSANDNMSVFFIREALETCSVDKKSYIDDMKLANDCLKEKYQDLKYKHIEIVKVSEDKAYSRLEVITNGEKKNTTLLLQIIDGKWIVLGYKEKPKTSAP